MTTTVHKSPSIFVAVIVLAHRGELTPTWLLWPGLLGLAGNIGATGGLFSLTSPATPATGSSAASCCRWAHS